MPKINQSISQSSFNVTSRLIQRQSNKFTIPILLIRLQAVLIGLFVRPPAYSHIYLRIYIFTYLPSHLLTYVRTYLIYPPTSPIHAQKGAVPLRDGYPPFSTLIGLVCPSTYPFAYLPTHSTYFLHIQPPTYLSTDLSCPPTSPINVLKGGVPL